MANWIWRLLSTSFRNRLVRQYILYQEAHDKKKSFKEEYRDFLHKYKVEYERNIYGIKLLYVYVI